MRSTLAAAQKPVVVAPLIDPGYLSVWSLRELAPDQREAAERVLANQLEFYEGKLEAYGLEPADALELSLPEAAFRITVAEFLMWARDYAMPLGVSIEKGADSRVGHLILRVPGGGARPIGWVQPTGEG
jgi:hypothetical protein